MLPPEPPLGLLAFPILPGLYEPQEVSAPLILPAFVKLSHTGANVQFPALLLVVPCITKEPIILVDGVLQ